MANSLGGLVVSLGLDAAEFTSGLTKSEYKAKQFSQQLDRTIASGIIKAELALRAAGAAAEFTFRAFQTLTSGAGDFQDLAEKTGGSAEGLASFAIAAATANTAMDTIADASVRLSKGLVGVDDESKAAGAALSALNIPLDKFKGLSPEDQIVEVAKALAGFEDGATKTAVAVTLFGKAGANLLPFLKELASEGGRQIVLTQKQIDLADAYADGQAKSAATLRLYAQAASSEAIPALIDLTNAGTEFLKVLIGVDSTTGKLAVNNGVVSFAEAGTNALAFLVDSGQGVVRVFQAVGRQIALELAVIKTFKDQGLAAAQALAKQGQDEQRASLAAPLFSQQLAQARAARKLLDDQRRVEDRGFKPKGAQINFDGAVKGGVKGGTAAAARNFADYATTVAQSIGRMAEESDVAKLGRVNAELVKLNELAAAGLDLGIVSDVRAKLLAQLPQQLESAAEAFRKFELAGTEASNNALGDEKLRRYNDEQQRFNALMEATPSAQLEKQRADMQLLAEAFDAGRISAEQFNEAAGARLGILDKGLENTSSLAKDLGLSFSSAFEDAIVAGSGLSDVLKGLEKDIVRIITRKMVTEPLGDFFAGALKGVTGGGVTGGGGGGGWLGNLLGSFAPMLIGAFGGGTYTPTGATGDFARLDRLSGRAVGGAVDAGGMYRVAENRPEVLDVGGKSYLMMGNKRGRVDPNPRMGGTRSQVVNNTFHFAGAVDQRTQTQMAAAAARAVSIANTRNN